MSDHAERSAYPWQLHFFTIWAGQQLSLIGSAVAQFALVWWVTKATGSATILATATLVALLPEVLLGPFAGALVDRWNRRKVMIVADGFIALASAWLVYLFWAGAMQVWHVYIIMLARSLGGIFHWPAMQASTSLMVPERHLARVAGLGQTMRGALSIVAPPLGALLLELLPLHGVMAIDVATAALAIAPLLFVPIPQPQRQAAEGGRLSLWGDVREGLRYIRSWPGLLAILVMASLINFLCNPAFSLMPILVTRHFGGGALQLGWIESTWGIGVVLGGLALGVWGGFRSRVLTALTGMIGMGLGILGVGLAPADAFLLAVAAMFVAGFMNSITNAPFHAIMQVAIAPEMQGRIFMVIGSVSSAMIPLGMAVAGPVADALGVRVWFVAGGVVCALMGAVALRTPAIVHLEENGKLKGTAPIEARPALDVAAK